MGGLGCGLSVVAAFFALLGFIPLLGWLNWITTLPLALLAVLFSTLALTRGERGVTATLGLIAGVLLAFWALFRLGIGGGFI